MNSIGYVSSTAGVTVTLGTNGALTIGQGGDAQGDKISGIESIAGSHLDDVLTGNSLANFLIGLDGNDTLIGGGAADTLLGFAGNDRLSGGTGADTLNGGTENDTLSYAQSKAKVIVTLGQNGALSVGQGGDAEGDQISNIENLIGSAFSDTLTGNNLDNVIEGRAGVAAHVCEVIVWSLAYAIVGAAPASADLAFVNYTTLGYGDVTPGGALAAAWTNDGDERRAHVRLVDCGHFRSAAESGEIRRRGGERWFRRERMNGRDLSVPCGTVRGTP